MALKSLSKGLFHVLLMIFVLTLSFSPRLLAQQDIVQNSGKGNSPGLLYYQNKHGVIKPVKTRTAWEKKRVQILDSMQLVMGKLPVRRGLPEMDIMVTDSMKGSNYTRLSINFFVAENERITAYLYLPFRPDKNEKFPAVLVLHGTGDPGKQLVDGRSPLANRAIAKELAQRGYVVIAPDYPGFGDMKEYDFDHDRYESGTMKGIFNHMRCVDLLQARTDVDSERIGVIGHSLGGHNSIFAGAFDKRIKVVVTSCGWTLLDYYNAGDRVTLEYGGRLGPWAQKRYMPLFRDKYKLNGEKIPFDFDEVISAIAPRPFFSNSPLYDGNFDVNGVKKGIAEVSEVYSFFKADGNLQIRYPASGHDFPTEVRLEAYQYIDKILKHTSALNDIE